MAALWVQPCVPAYPVIPFLVHDLNLVPTEQRKNAKLMYTYWLLLILTLIINFVGCIFLNK